MPNKPRPENPVRHVRVEDELWARVARVARKWTKTQGGTVTPSEVTRVALRQLTDAELAPEQPEHDRRKEQGE